MIKVNVYFDNKEEITKIEVSGHANFSTKGNDIVCAGISAIMFGGANTLDQYNEKIIIEDNFFLLEKISTEEKSFIILKTIFIQLKTIEKKYSKYITINKVRN